MAKLESEQICKRFDTCSKIDRNLTILGLWRLKEAGNTVLELVSDKGSIRKICVYSSVSKLSRSRQLMAIALELLHQWLLRWIDDSSMVIHVHSNIGKLVTYVAKDLYPAGLEDAHYILSLKIGRLLEGDGTIQTVHQMYGFYIN